MAYIGTMHPLSHQGQQPVEYFFRLGEDEVPLNHYLGKNIQIDYLGKIHCIYCGRRTKKSYNGGSCYPCFRDRPENDLCIVKPETCHFQQGTCRDEEFGRSHCMQPHYVYLALSSEVKVGITRKPNALKRWVDQGAVEALPIAEVKTRHEAGELEVHLSQYVKDKTNWRRMLKNDISHRNLYEVRNELIPSIPEKFRNSLLTHHEVFQFHYPSLSVPDKITSFNLDKHPTIKGHLTGIKGQYLILDTGVINVRKFSGYLVQLVL